MRTLSWLLSLNLLAAGAAETAQACMTHAQWKVADVDYADVIVTGRIANYEIILDPVVRQRNRELAARRGDAKLEQPDRGSYLADYAKFDILVDDVLRGDVGEKLTATWDNSTFSEPRAMAPGPFIIALRLRNSPLPPLRGPSATVLPTPTTSEFTVLQAPCAAAFIFPVVGEEASRIREHLADKK